MFKYLVELHICFYNAFELMHQKNNVLPSKTNALYLFLPVLNKSQNDLLIKGSHQSNDSYLLQIVLPILAIVLFSDIVVIFIENKMSRLFLNWNSDCLCLLNVKRDEPTSLHPLSFPDVLRENSLLTWQKGWLRKEQITEWLISTMQK